MNQKHKKKLNQSNINALVGVGGCGWGYKGWVLESREHDFSQDTLVKEILYLSEYFLG